MTTTLSTPMSAATAKRRVGVVEDGWQIAPFALATNRAA